MEDREDNIKTQLKKIAQLEMQKGIDEDEMLDMTLKAIEIVNIADMASEKEQLEQAVDALLSKKADLEALEDNLIREKQKNINKIRGTSENKALTRGGTISIKKVGSLTQPEEPTSAILNVNMQGSTAFN
jgi:hypothetical protein